MRIPRSLSCAALLHLVAAQDPCNQARQPEGVIAGSKCLKPQGRWQQRFAAGARAAARAYTYGNLVGSSDVNQKCPKVDATNLEDLLPEQHFRGPLQGPRQYFKRVPPHYLANHANVSGCRRRVYIDVGARDFEHGLREMFGWYPALGAFDEFYAFEAVAGFYKLPTPSELSQILLRYMTPDRVATFARRHFFFQVRARVSIVDQGLPGSAVTLFGPQGVSQRPHLGEGSGCVRAYKGMQKSVTPCTSDLYPSTHTRRR